MADRKSLLLEAAVCVGSDNMFKGCVRANPLWGEPCFGSMPACWWALLRCCQRHHDNGQSMQNHFRNADGSGGINETHTKLHTYMQAVTSHLKMRGQGVFSVQEIKGNDGVWPHSSSSWSTNTKTLYKVYNPLLGSISVNSSIFSTFNNKKKSIIQNYLKAFRDTWQRSSRVLGKPILFWH